MEEIGKSLPAVFKRQLRKAGPQLAEILAPLWARAAGRAIAKHSRPAAFDAGKLTLHADSKTWAVQLAMMQEQIVSKINEFLGSDVVKELEVRVAPESAAEFEAGKSFRAGRIGMTGRSNHQNLGRSGKGLD